ncbi:diacylglycerol O-acyltransferase 1-like isoform X2 [Gigantopelta aegis]|uniref:diacylglycerol O-acyltransferase 1-like isoform X2 n=1 Tax=Gigantopelta aegis TaxID=1735272 RepID=UPI001B888F4D|nr:diacylglycerol O-acyltransferase 1-like isoform X2 [Gigantopelta aegis]
MKEPEFMMYPKHEKIPHVVHRNADSFFSTSSGFTNYRGLLNLCMILLILSNARLFLENIIKYGILIDPSIWMNMYLKDPESWPNILLLLSINIFILIAYVTEIFLEKSWLSDNMGIAISIVNNIVLLVYPATVVFLFHPNPIFSVNTLGIVTVIFLKLVSYACVNNWCRSHRKNRTLIRRKTISVSDETSNSSSNKANGKVETKLCYPDNLTLSDLYYFIFAPTLCYELNFPRSARIRKRFLLKRILEMLFLCQLMLGLVQQWIIPTINNSMQPLADMNISKVVERLLKLAIPNHFIWLIFFYWFFHSCLNVLAELLRFGDREFYRDWWNAETVTDFWKSWNIPVHRWATRHLYKPMLRRGISKIKAAIAVFFVSAFFHEYLMSIPLHMFRTWAFTSMVMQVPLAIVTAKFLSGKGGNIVVWLTLILGQPVAILAYVHDYYVRNVGTLHDQTFSIN